MKTDVSYKKPDLHEDFSYGQNTFETQSQNYVQTNDTEVDFLRVTLPLGLSLYSLIFA